MVKMTATKWISKDTLILS